MSDSVRPHRGQPNRLPSLWDPPDKNTGVNCYFLLQCMKVRSESEVTQPCATLSDPMDCSLPGSSVHGFSRQEYWSGVPLPSLLYHYILLISQSNSTVTSFIKIEAVAGRKSPFSNSLHMVPVPLLWKGD